MSSISLRPAGAPDIEAIVAVIHAAFDQYKAVLTPPSGAHSETVVSVGKKMAAGGAHLAYVHGNLAGTVLYYPEHGQMYLGRLAVLPAYRGHGVARLLVEAVEQRAIEAGFRQVHLGVRLALAQNLAYFQGLGYRIDHYAAHNGYAEPTFAILVKDVVSRPMRGR